MVRKRISGVVSLDFEKNVRKMFPHKSLFHATKELNKTLEEMLFGSKKKR